MTPTRRARKPKKSKLVRNVMESSEEESSDAGSVTRCICGESHNLGLMVQCDKCEVWQHCECIGLIQEKLPDHYYCDKCQPENHQFIKTSTGRSKRLYSATSTTTTTITTTTAGWSNNNNNNNNNNNSEGDTSKVPSTANKRRKTTTTQRKTATASPTQQQKKEFNVSINSSEVLIPAVEGESVFIPAATTKLEEETSEALLIEERLTRSRRTQTSTPSQDNSITEEVPVTRKKTFNRRAVSSSPSPLSDIKRSKNNSPIKVSTPTHFMEEEILPPYWNYNDGKPTRESSPPAKVKYPHSKMTFSDMSRRAKQIMECISKMQLEEKPLDEFLFIRPRSLSTSSSSSSLSSASTVPLLDDYTTTSASSPSTPLPFTKEETSNDILERVNRELIKFQRKFGIAYQRNNSNSSRIASFK